MGIISRNGNTSNNIFTNKPLLLQRFSTDLNNDSVKLGSEENINSIGQLIQDYAETNAEEDILFPGFTDAELASNLLAMYSSINHRFWTKEDDELLPVYYDINGEKIKGSSYLDRCFRQLVTDNPEFFKTENIKDFNLDKFHYIFGEEIFPDEVERFEIMKNFIDLTIGKYNKSMNEIWKNEAGETIEGLHKILDKTEGFKDPLQKKTQMYVKFMTYQKIWEAKDKENIVPPLDYHLMNIAVKTGLIDVHNKLRNELIARQPLNQEETQLIRIQAINVYNKIEKKFGISPYLMDDILWAQSRTVCQNIEPDCPNCLFKDACKSNNSDKQLKKSFPVIYTNAF